jgi:hypothetical protein
MRAMSMSEPRPGTAHLQDLLEQAYEASLDLARTLPRGDPLRVAVDQLSIELVCIRSNLHAASKPKETAP